MLNRSTIGNGSFCMLWFCGGIRPKRCLERIYAKTKQNKTIYILYKIKMMMMMTFVHGFVSWVTHIVRLWRKTIIYRKKYKNITIIKESCVLFHFVHIRCEIRFNCKFLYFSVWMPINFSTLWIILRHKSQYIEIQ